MEQTIQHTLFPGPNPDPAAVRPRVFPTARGKVFVDQLHPAQQTLEVRKVDDLVPQDAAVRMVKDVLDALDFTAFEAKCPGGGAPRRNPRLLCSIIVYAIMSGVQSAREMSRRLERDLHFMWLAREERIHHDTISRFRRAFKPEIEDLFCQTVRLAMELGMTGLGCIAIDGTKLAGATARRGLSERGMDRAQAKIADEVAALLAEMEAVDTAEDQELGASRGDEISQKLADAEQRRQSIEAARQVLQERGDKRVSLTDLEAREMKTMDGTRTGYNGQLAVDEESGIATAQQVTTEQNDTQQLAPMVQQTIGNTGCIPDEFVADTGYHSAQALEFALQTEGINAYIAQYVADSEGLFTHDDFTYDPESDTLTCPAGQVLRRGPDRVLTGTIRQCYQTKAVCHKCEMRSQCMKPGTKTKRHTVMLVPHHQLLSAMRKKVLTPEGQRAIKARGRTVERVFGTMKAVLRLRQFLLRGRDGAAIQFTLTAIAYNLRTILAWITAQAAERLPAGG